MGFSSDESIFLKLRITFGKNQVLMCAKTLLGYLRCVTNPWSWFLQMTKPKICLLGKKYLISLS